MILREPPDGRITRAYIGWTWATTVLPTFSTSHGQVLSPSLMSQLLTMIRCKCLEPAWIWFFAGVGSVTTPPVLCLLSFSFQIPLFCSTRAVKLEIEPYLLWPVVCCADVVHLSSATTSTFLLRQWCGTSGEAISTRLNDNNIFIFTKYEDIKTPGQTLFPEVKQTKGHCRQRECLSPC